ncbi:MAG TPA: hypothetical protein VHQ86_04900 [Candidatus Saccharimonadia bacterium]|jgi:hypothetical protein|nr:hypothetical protein [Candidatus Saccharimonadia bacterium]
MDKSELTQIIDQLIKLGEDADELHYWVDIYDDLEPEAKAALADNLKGELAKLEALKKAA